MTGAMYWVKFRKRISADEHKDYEEEVPVSKLIELLSNDKVTVFSTRLIDYTTPQKVFKTV